MLFHPASQKLLDTYKLASPGALLISGQPGVGLVAAASYLAQGHDILRVAPQNAKNQPDPNGTITVETIRGLYEATQGKRSSEHYVLLEDAHTMSRGAQTAFLKLLEEPTPHTHFVLTTHNPAQLLPTIRSRVQQAIIHPLTSEQTVEFIGSLGVTDQAHIAKLRFIADGLPDELDRLVKDQEYFQECATIMTDARELLGADTYKKLLIVSSYKDDRAKAERLVEAMIMILRRTVSAKPQTSLLHKLETLLEVQSHLRMNANVRLTLTEFVL